MYTLRHLMVISVYWIWIGRLEALQSDWLIDIPPGYATNLGMKLRLIQTLALPKCCIFLKKPLFQTDAKARVAFTGPVSGRNEFAPADCASLIQRLASGERITEALNIMNPLKGRNPSSFRVLSNWSSSNAANHRP